MNQDHSCTNIEYGNETNESNRLMNRRGECTKRFMNSKDSWIKSSWHFSIRNLVATKPIIGYFCLMLIKFKQC